MLLKNGLNFLVTTIIRRGKQIVQLLFGTILKTTALSGCFSLSLLMNSKWKFIAIENPRIIFIAKYSKNFLYLTTISKHRHFPNIHILSKRLVVYTSRVSRFEEKSFFLNECCSFIFHTCESWKANKKPVILS